MGMCVLDISIICIRLRNRWKCQAKINCIITDKLWVFCLSFSIASLQRRKKKPQNQGKYLLILRMTSEKGLF